jgi:hypothetical protein
MRRGDIMWLSGFGTGLVVGILLVVTVNCAVSPEQGRLGARRLRAELCSQAERIQTFWIRCVRAVILAGAKAIRSCREAVVPSPCMVAAVSGRSRPAVEVLVATGQLRESLARLGYETKS